MDFHPCKNTSFRPSLCALPLDKPQAIATQLDIPAFLNALLVQIVYFCGIVCDIINLFN